MKRPLRNEAFDLGFVRELVLRLIPHRGLRWRVEGRFIDAWLAERRDREAREWRRQHPQPRDPVARAELTREARLDLLGSEGFVRFARARLIEQGHEPAAVDVALRPYALLAETRGARTGEVN